MLHVAELVATGLELPVNAPSTARVEWSERQRATALGRHPYAHRTTSSWPWTSTASAPRSRSSTPTYATGPGTARSRLQLAPESTLLQDRIRRRARLGRRAAAVAPDVGAVEDVIAANLAAWVSYIEVAGRLAALRSSMGWSRSSSSGT